MEELLFKFLNKNFDVVLDQDFKIIFKNSSETITKQSIKEDISKIFFITFQNNSFENLINEWLKDKANDFIGGLNDFLKDCEITLGSTNWGITHKLYGKINLDNINNLPIDSPLKHHQELLNLIVDEWYDEEVIKASEKMMGINENDIW
jgi:hypothetical protein